MEEYSKILWLNKNYKKLYGKYSSYRDKGLKISNQGDFLNKIILGKGVLNPLTNVSERELQTNKMNLIYFMAKWVSINPECLWQLATDTVIDAAGTAIKATDNVISLMLFNNIIDGEFNVTKERIQQVIKNDLNILPQKEIILYMDTMNDLFPLCECHYCGATIVYRGVSYRSMTTYLSFLMTEALPTYLVSFNEIASSSKTELIKQYIMESFTGLVFSNNEVTRKILNDAYDNLNYNCNIFTDMSLDDKVRQIKQSSDAFIKNLKQAIKDGYYTFFTLEEEKDAYQELFKTINSALARVNDYMNQGKARGWQVPFGIKEYYIYDQPNREANRLKIDYSFQFDVMAFFNQSKLEQRYDTLHPDIQVGLFHLLLHLDLTGCTSMYYRGSHLHNFINWITSKNYCRKPVLIKSLIKKVCEDIYLQMKERGLIRFHQLEALFCYRNSHLILDEVREDYKNWVTGDTAGFGVKQGEFIDTYYSDFRNMMVAGNTLGQIFRRNYLDNGEKEGILKDPYKYLSAKGVVDDFRVDTDHGKRSISKSRYFNLICSPQQFFRRKRRPRRNKVIIKKTEFIKQRIVINTTLNTYQALAPINEMVKVITQGTGVLYFSSSRDQKAQLMARLQKYLLYNKFVENRYLILPLDYSSYDHTITKEFIFHSLNNLFDDVGVDMSNEMDTFAYWMDKEVINFPELKNDSINDSMYKFGMLSGWKITSSVESLGNAITSCGVMKKLGLKLEELLTMGDDLYMVVELPGLSKEQIKDVLNKVCSEYEKLGFKMNASKNSAGYYFGEFLRVTYIPNVVIGYPLRVLPSITVNKQDSNANLFGITEFLSAVRRICRRYNASSRFCQYVEYLGKKYKKEDIRKYAADYVLHPYNYKIIRKRVERYRYNLIVKHTPIYNRLKGVFTGYESYLKDYINNELVTNYVEETRLFKLPVKFRPNLKSHEVGRVHELLKNFSFHYSDRVDRKSSITLGDYNIQQIVKSIIQGEKMTIDNAVSFVINVNKYAVDNYLITMGQFINNIPLISNVKSKRELFSALGDERVSIFELDVPVLIVSRIKHSLMKYINNRISSLTENDARLLKSILRKNRNWLIQMAVTKVVNQNIDYFVAGYRVPLSLLCD